MWCGVRAGSADVRAARVGDDGREFGGRQAPALRGFLRWVGWQVGVVVLLLPWIPVALRQVGAYPGRETAPVSLPWALGVVWYAANIGTALREDEGLLQAIG